MSDSPNTISQVQCFFCFPFYLKNQQCAMWCGPCFDMGIVPCPCCEYRSKCCGIVPSCANLPAGKDSMHTGNEWGQQCCGHLCCIACWPLQWYLSFSVYMGNAQWGDANEKCCCVHQPIINKTPDAPKTVG